MLAPVVGAVGPDLAGEQYVTGEKFVTGAQFETGLIFTTTGTEYILIAVICTGVPFTVLGRPSIRHPPAGIPAPGTEGDEHAKLCAAQGDIALSDFS